MKGIIAGAVLGLGLISQSYAEVLIDVRNDTSEDCSLAVNARIDKTKWITQGWYVFASGEEAPIILKDINDAKIRLYYFDLAGINPEEMFEILNGKEVSCDNRFLEHKTIYKLEAKK